MFVAALTLFLVPILDWGFAHYGFGLVEFAWSPLNAVFLQIAWIFPLGALIYLPPGPRAVRWIARIVLALAVTAEVLIALPVLCYLPMTIRTGYARGALPLFSTRVRDENVVVHLSPPLLNFQKYGVFITRERRLPLGLVLVRVLYGAYPARDGMVQPIGADSLRITIWQDFNRSGPARDTTISLTPLAR